MLDRFAREQDLEFDRDLLNALSEIRLVNTLSTALPFTSVEKQALLEATSPEERATLLITLMEIGLGAEGASVPYSPPTIH